MDEKLKQAYLYDFYGELLNEHQRRIYEEFHFQDFSLGEIAEDECISRQGVADVVKRCDRKLEAYEDKLHLVEKFLKIRADAEEIERLAAQLREMAEPDFRAYGLDIEQNGQDYCRITEKQTADGNRISILQQIVTLTQEIIEEL